MAVRAPIAIPPFLDIIMVRHKTDDGQNSISGGGPMMKRALLAGFSMLLISHTATAQYPPNASIGLFADSEHTHNYVCPFEGPYLAQIEMWIWCIPSSRGQIGAEFAISYPGNVFQGVVTYNNDLISVLLGTLAEGIGFVYSECQTDWNWPCHQSFLIMTHGETDVELVPHPDLLIPVIQFWNCLEGYPTEQAYVLSHLHLNQRDPWSQSCYPPTVLVPIQADESSWGAIKSLYK